MAGTWNDLDFNGDNNSPDSPYYPQGYIVEYGGMPGDPELNLSSSTNLLAPPVITLETFFGVDCALISLNASSNEGDGSVFWFEDENGGESIYYGTSFEPGSLNAGDYSFWV